MGLRSFIGPVRSSDNLIPTKFSVRLTERWPELPWLTLLGASKEEKALSESLPEFVRNVYGHAVLLLGEHEAKTLFMRTVTKKRGGRGRGRNLASNRDAVLLEEYDRVRRAVEKHKHQPRILGRIPRLLASRLHAVRPGLYGVTAQAIERRLRQLLREREQRRIEAEREKRLTEAGSQLSLLKAILSLDAEK